LQSTEVIILEWQTFFVQIETEKALTRSLPGNATLPTEFSHSGIFECLSVKWAFSQKEMPAENRRFGHGLTS
jgi:hypothetical protein